MENIKNNNILTSNAFFDALDLNEDMKKIYELIGDDKLYEDNNKLAKLRSKNHRRYHAINILKYTDLPIEFNSIINSFLNVYNSIDKNKILVCDYSTSLKINELLDDLYSKIRKLDEVVKIYLQKITKENDKNQSKFSIEYFNGLDLDKNKKQLLIDKYNSLVIYTSYIREDIYDDLKSQVKRKQLIEEMNNIISGNNNSKEVLLKNGLNEINSKINELIIKYKDKIQYLEDIIPNQSKYLNEFKNFKDYYNSIFAYDDENYDVSKKVYDLLVDETKFKQYVSNFEDLFIQEIYDREKVNIDEPDLDKENLKNIIEHIENTYKDKLDLENINIINYVLSKLNNKDYDIKDLNKAIKLVIRRIWENTITDVYSFNPNEDYHFICSNNQFIDIKYQTILITKDEVNRSNQYGDYQIGFICKYTDNILYTTDKEDIMDDKDSEIIETPIDLENKFSDFSKCSRIALDGYKTKIDAVYFIDDGNKEKYMSALNLANTCKLPLLILKK